MHCCERRSDQTLKVTLLFLRKELLYDVQNYAFVEGDIMNDNEEHSRHQVFDIAEIGNVDRVTRVFNLAHTECLELLYPFTKKALEDELVFNDELKEPEEYTIEMEVSTEFSKSTIVLLENLIHEYFICRALSDWMSITKPTSKANWQEKLDDIKNRIKNSVLWRRKRLRITQHPF